MNKKSFKSKLIHVKDIRSLPKFIKIVLEDIKKITKRSLLHKTTH